MTPIGLGLAGARLGYGLAQGAGAAPAAGWWVVAGKTCVAAYQPKGAASLAASYVNLANPGTYDAAPGVAPTHNTLSGWGFTGTQWLTTGYTLNSASHTVLMQFTDCLIAFPNYLFGVWNSPGSFTIWNANADSLVFYNGGARTVGGGQIVAGNLGIAGQQGYKNGAAAGAAIPAGTAPNAACHIAKMNGFGSLSRLTVVAMAIYSAVLTGPEVAAVSTAMAAL